MFKPSETTRRLFKAICQARPGTLLVIVDAPRPRRPDEAARTSQTRALIDSVDWNSLDWGCQSIKRYTEANLGCAQSIIQAQNAGSFGLIGR